MKRRALMTALLAVPVLPTFVRAQSRAVALAPRDQADVARVEAYLDTLHTLKARFLQVAADGATAGGIVWLDRPGKMRFQYDAPSPLLLVAGGGLVVFHDDQLNQTSNIPLGQTPLGILLADQVKLSGDVTLTGIDRLPGQLQLSMVRTASPGDGSLTLVFSDGPLALKQWSVIDAQGRETRVTLFDVQLGGSFDSKLFYYADPRLMTPRNSPGGSGG